MFVCVITGRSSASNTEMLVKIVVKALAAFENPEMRMYKQLQSPQQRLMTPLIGGEQEDRPAVLQRYKSDRNEGETTTPNAGGRSSAVK